MTTPTVTRGDIEAKLNEIGKALTTQAEGARERLVPVGVAVAIVIVILAYLMGRRRGNKKTTVVEIRRV
jgi:hypothetical protein